MDWLYTNWFWILLIILFFTMIVFGHRAYRGRLRFGGHGGVAGQRGREEMEDGESKVAGVDSTLGGHQA